MDMNSLLIYQNATLLLKFTFGDIDAERVASFMVFHLAGSFGCWNRIEVAA